MLTIKNPKSVVWADIPLEELARGDASDTYFTYKINEILENNYDSEDQRKLIEYVLSPLLVVVARMEFNGIDLSEEKMKELSKELDPAIMESEDMLFSMDGVEPTDNLNSAEDLGKILFSREGGMELYPPDWTAKKKPKTCKNTLAILLEQIDDELSTRSRSKSNRSK